MVTSSEGTQWLGGLDSQRHYDLLADWAERSKNADKLQPLPEELCSKSLSPYREQEQLVFESNVR
jgi:hypothetical protein